MCRFWTVVLDYYCLKYFTVNIIAIKEVVLTQNHQSCGVIEGLLQNSLPSLCVMKGVVGASC